MNKLAVPGAKGSKEPQPRSAPGCSSRKASRLLGLENLEAKNDFTDQEKAGVIIMIDDAQFMDAK